jgi:hypothetical protein
MHIHDLSAYQYRIPFHLQAVRCVGWLDAEHPYETGQLPVGFIGKLEEIIQHRSETFDPHVNVVRGIHPCNLCRRDIEVISGGRKTMLGMSEIWLPGDSGWLASPSLVIHYISEHGYFPPPVFLQVVGQLSIADRFLAQEVYDRLVGEQMAL